MHGLSTEPAGPCDWAPDPDPEREERDRRTLKAYRAALESLSRIGLYHDHRRLVCAALKAAQAEGRKFDLEVAETYGGFE